MAASSTDLLRKTTSGTRPENAYLTASKSVGASNISVSTTTGWNTDTGQDFVLFLKDTSNEMVPGTLTTWVGVVSGTTVTNLVLKAGTEPVGGYPSGENSVVIATPTAAWSTDFITALLTQHTQTGAHGNITATGYTQSSGTFAIPSGVITPNNVTASTGSTWDYSSYTPTLTDITLGTGGTASGYYKQIGKTVHYFGTISLGTAPTVGSTATVTLPVNASSHHPSLSPIGTVQAFDSSAGTGSPGQAVKTAATQAFTPYFVVVSSAPSFANLSATSTNGPFTWAVSDTLWWNIQYEAA